EDESTAVIFGMPKAAINSKSVEYVLPYPEIPNKINELIQGSGFRV
ncbi:MAG: chemotaxis protein CheB, partial [Candidatus Anammoxibacter sp.]